MSALDRRAVVAALLAERSAGVGGDDLLVVAGLGTPAWDVTAAGDDDRTFPLWGAMGGAAMIGLGLAIARPHQRVLVVTGDGEQLMGLGALSTVGHQQPANLAIVVLDNEHYGETGMQPTHTQHRTDLAAAAAACGIGSTWTVRSAADAADLPRRLWAEPGPRCCVVKVAAETLPLVLPPRDGALLARRFRAAVTGIDG